MPVPEIDSLLGIEVYSTKTFGVGGVIREAIDDFVVEEVLVDGSKANVEGTLPNHVLGSSSVKQRYLLCILVKRNWDTFVAIKNVAKQLGIDQGQVQFAGIKDAKAVTAQFVTVENCLVEDAAKVNVKDIVVRPVGYAINALSLFYLLGNHFSIKIRGIQQEESITGQIAETAKEIEASGGIPNFFGHQRFGTTRPITHLVGKAIVKGDFEEAAMVFLAKPSIDEHPQSRQVREELQSTRDFKQALMHFPKQLRFERLMLNYLAEKPSDFVGAFGALPVRLQMLFVQAHQSYLFNHFLSERVKQGYALNKAEIGDYVVGVERSGLPLVNSAKMVTAGDLTQTNEYVKAGRLRVAMPIVGFKQKLSQGVMGEIEQRVLEEEDVDMDGFRVAALSKLGGRGGLRTVVTPVKDFNVSVKADIVDLSFMLLKGSYATVLLREIMKPSNPISAGF